MTTNKTIEILENYNAWREAEKGVKLNYHQEEITEAISQAITILKVQGMQMAKIIYQEQIDKAIKQLQELKRD